MNFVNNNNNLRPSPSQLQVNEIATLFWKKKEKKERRHL